MKWYENVYSIFFVSLTFGFIGWSSHAILEFLLIYDKPFLNIFILDVAFEVIIFRLIVSFGFFIFAAILSDVLYKQKIAEEKLKKAHDELNSINKDLEIRIEQKTNEIEKLLNQKNEIILQLSHDLRTPLTPVMGLLPIILKEEKDPKLKDLIKISIKNIDYLRDIVSKIIELTKLDSTVVDFSFEDIKLYSEVNKIIDKKEFTFEKNNIDVENKIEENIYVKADRLKLNEVFNQLFSNSINFSKDDGGKITIDAREHKDFVIISVRDIGIGLENKHLNNIFNEFYKADEARHNHDHSGLGLSICRRIVEKHGGRIWAENPNDGDGLFLRFTLPKSNTNN